MGLGLKVFSIGQATRGPQKIFSSKRGPQPKKFENRWIRVTIRPGFPGFVQVLWSVSRCPDDLWKRAK